MQNTGSLSTRPFSVAHTIAAVRHRAAEPARQYLVAVGATLAAVGVALAVDLPLHADTNFLLVAAVAVSAWYGGRGPAVVATLLAALAIGYCFLPPHFVLKTPGAGGSIYLAAFLLVALVVTATAEALRGARREAEGRAEQLEELTVELEQQMEEVRTLSEDLQQSNHALSESLDVAERVGDRATRLGEVAGALSEAATVAEVAQVVVERGLDVVRASRGALWQLDDAGACALLASRGYSPAVRSRLGTTAAGDETPVGQTLRTDEAVWVRSPDELRVLFPTFHEQLGPAGRAHTYAALPLAHRGRRVGALLLCFAEASAPGVTDAAFTTLLAQAAAGALLRARAFDAQREARREAELVAQARSDVLGVVAHDLRNPLNLISSTTALLLDEALPADQQRQMLRIARRAVRQMDRLIEDLLDATRLQAGRLTLALADVDVRALVRQVEETCRPLAAERGVSLAVAAPRAHTLIRADEGRLLQALGNLVGNAVKFTPRDGHVVLTADAAPEGIVFHVRDDGPGIPAASLPRLFDRFWQARTGDRRGAGLGLAIAKGIVEAHGGRLWVESALGAGSNFAFSVPAPARA